MDITNDPRIFNQMKFLKGVPLRHTKWVQDAVNWDHDHCKFCHVEIDASTEGMVYCTEDYVKWICEECYNDFKEAFEWVLVDEPVPEEVEQ